MGRQVHLPAPGIAGMFRDGDDIQVPLAGSYLAYDAVAPFGLLRTRGQWEFENAVDYGEELFGISRMEFVLADATRTVVSPIEQLSLHPGNTDVIDHNLGAGAAKYFWLYRGMYRDEAIFCCQLDDIPLVRYSGSALAYNATNHGVGSTTAGQGITTLAAATAPAGAGPGAYYHASFATGTTTRPYQGYRILEKISASVLTLESWRASTAQNSLGGDMIQPWAYGYPAVDVYSAGTITIAGANVTGTGTNWSPKVSAFTGWDALLVIDPTGNNQHQHAVIATAPSGTAMTTVAQAVTNATYAITRQLPFKEAKAWRGCLFGTGVPQYPNRVYYGPPGWNLSFPPGTVEPFDVTDPPIESDPDFFRMGYIEVPNAHDGDPNIALLSGPDALYSLKRNSIHRITGNWPSFSQQPVAQGIGCIDIRSAIETERGLYFASEWGVHRIDPGGQIVNLMEDRLQREWRNLIYANSSVPPGSDGFICCMAVQGGYLHLCVQVTGVPGTEPYYVMNLETGAWESKFRRSYANHLFTSHLDGETEKLWAANPYVEDGRVADYTNMVTADPTGEDEPGLGYPAFEYHSTDSLAQAAGIDGEARMLDLAVHAKVPPGTTMTTSHKHAGGRLTGNDTTRTKTVQTVGGTNPELRRYSGVSNRSGRQHQVVITGSAGDPLTLGQITADFRDSRAGS